MNSSVQFWSTLYTTAHASVLFEATAVPTGSHSSAQEILPERSIGSKQRGNVTHHNVILRRNKL